MGGRWRVADGGWWRVRYLHVLGLDLLNQPEHVLHLPQELVALVLVRAQLADPRTRGHGQLVLRRLGVGAFQIPITQRLRFGRRWHARRLFARLGLGLERRRFRGLEKRGRW